MAESTAITTAGSPASIQRWSSSPLGVIVNALVVGRVRLHADSPVPARNRPNQFTTSFPKDAGVNPAGKLVGTAAAVGPTRTRYDGTPQ